MPKPMTTEHKKAFLLLKWVIFSSYHGLDKDEKASLQKSAEELNAQEEFEWVKRFAEEDEVHVFERARVFFKSTISTYDVDTKLSYLNTVWDATNQKGYISEIEAMAILKLAKDWGVEKDLLNIVRK